MADRHLQPVGSPTWGAWGRQAWPEDGDRLGSDALQAMQQAVSRLKPGLNVEDLFTKGPGGNSGDPRTLCPSLLALGFDKSGLRLQNGPGRSLSGQKKKKAKVISKG